MWAIARLALQRAARGRRQICVVGCALLLGGAMVGGVAGNFLGPIGYANSNLAEFYGINEISHFNRVAGIHLGSYLGAAGGLISALARTWWVSRNRANPATPSPP